MTTEVREAPAETTEAAPQATEAESEVPSDVADFIASRKAPEPAAAETKGDGTEPDQETVQDSQDAELEAAIEAAAAVKAEKLAADTLAAKTAETEAKAKAQSVIDRQQRVKDDYANRTAQVDAALKDFKDGKFDFDAMPLQNGRQVNMGVWLMQQFNAHHGQQETAFFEAAKASLAEHLPEAEREAFINRVNPKTPEESLALYGAFAEAIAKQAREGYKNPAEVEAMLTKKLVSYRAALLAGTPAEVEARLATMRSQVRVPQANGMGIATGGWNTVRWMAQTPEFRRDHPEIERDIIRQRTRR